MDTPVASNSNGSAKHDNGDSPKSSDKADPPPVKNEAPPPRFENQAFSYEFGIQNYVPPARNEPHVEPVNGIVHPPVVPPPNRPGRLTNQLAYLKNTVIKGTESFICVNFLCNLLVFSSFQTPAFVALCCAGRHDKARFARLLQDHQAADGLGHGQEAVG